MIAAAGIYTWTLIVLDDRTQDSGLTSSADGWMSLLGILRASRLEIKAFKDNEAAC